MHDSMQMSCFASICARKHVQSRRYTCIHTHKQKFYMHKRIQQSCDASIHLHQTRQTCALSEFFEHGKNAVQVAYMHTYMHEKNTIIIYIYIYIYTYRYTYTYTYTYIHVHIHIHACMYTHTHTNTYIPHTQIYTYIYIHTYIHVYLFVIISYIHMHTCIAEYSSDNKAKNFPSIQFSYTYMHIHTACSTTHTHTTYTYKRTRMNTHYELVNGTKCPLEAVSWPSNVFNS
jgi:hypothetical protein